MPLNVVNIEHAKARIVDGTLSEENWWVEVEQTIVQLAVAQTQFKQEHTRLKLRFDVKTYEENHPDRNPDFFVKHPDRSKRPRETRDLTDEQLRNVRTKVVLEFTGLPRPIPSGLKTE